MDYYIKRVIRNGIIEFLVLLIILSVCGLIVFQMYFIFFKILLLGIILYTFFTRFIGLIKNRKLLKNISVEDKKIFDKEIAKYLYKTKENYIFTKNYIFFFDAYCAEICKYEDIILAYKELYLGNRVGPQESYYILTKKGNKFKVLLWSFDADKNNKDFDFQKILIDKNPNILVGRTKENKKIIKEKYKLKI